MSVQDMDIAALTSSCAEESRRFRRGEPHRDEFCYELMRRALAGRDANAWSAVEGQYRAMVVVWVRHHPASASAREETEFYVARVFQRLWTSLAGDRFAGFRDVASVLRYLKMCVHGVLVDEARAQHEMETLEGDEAQAVVVAGPEAEAVDRVAAAELWQAIAEELSDDAERRLIHLSCVLGLKPAEIQTRDPARFPSVADVYRIKRNALDRLRNSARVRAFLEDEPQNVSPRRSVSGGVDDGVGRRSLGR